MRFTRQELVNGGWSFGFGPWGFGLGFRVLGFRVKALRGFRDFVVGSLLGVSGVRACGVLSVVVRKVRAS